MSAPIVGEAEYSLVLRNAHLIDPSQDLDGVMDVAIKGDKIAKVGHLLQAGALEEDLRGKYVCPGLVDLHGHWWEGSSFGIDPDICLNHGVTTAVDAGTTGFINFSVFRRNQIEAATVRVLAFVNISGIGIPTPLVGELEDLRFARPLETSRVIDGNRDLCVGVKIREGSMTGRYGREALDRAITAADSTGLPLMVHISKGANTPYILRKLRPGDIVTHCFQGRGDGIFEEGNRELLPEVTGARQEGILFDIGHGAGSFSWATARRAFEHFFYPDTISTDLHRFSIARWAFDMPSVMSKFLHLGMSLHDVVAKSTWVPAKAIGLGNQLGTLKPGSIADLFVFELEEGDFPLEDTHLRTEYTSRRIKPVLIIKDGRAIQPGSYSVRLRDFEECDQELFRFVEDTADNF